MITHTDAEALFKRCRNKSRGYKLANKTRLQQRGRAFAVRLHETDIVIIRPDGTYRLNSGGWRTKTTKTRMNEILPRYGVSQTIGIWSVGDEFFTDGMLVGQDGQAVIKTRPVKETLEIKARVDYYCAKFVRVVSKACIGRDVGYWSDHKKHGVPRSSSREHLAQLWNTIANATWKNPYERILDVSYIGFNGKSFGERLRVLLYLATIDRGHGEPRFVWDTIRTDCRNFRDSFFITSNLQSFLRPRKPFIADMIVSGDLEIKPKKVKSRTLESSLS